MLDLPSVFDTPQDVLTDEYLKTSQRNEILRRWEYDACEVSVAEDEGMQARNGDALKQILQALQDLVGDIDSSETPPTKQGGLSREALRRTNRKA
ncbi:MAG: hypothetical protein ACSHXW_20405 [Yoonia sp.]